MPLYGTVHHFDPGELLHQLAGEMHCPADAGRAVLDLAGVRLGIRDQLAQRFRGQRGIREDQRGAGTDERDGAEVLVDVEGQLRDRGVARV